MPDVDLLAADRVAREVAGRVGEHHGDWPGMNVVATMPGGFVVENAHGEQFDVKVTRRRAPHSP